MKNIINIGIVGWSTGDLSFGTTKSYLHYFGLFGKVRILTPTDSIDEDLDLVVMPGGRDTLPTNYGAIPGYFNTEPDPFKEHFAKVNLLKYIDAGIPIFGICLGFQQLCVHFGAPLMQNINTNTHGYSGTGNGDRSELVNDLIFAPQYTVLEARLLANSKSKKSKISTCSLHHQGVNIANIPECLNLIAYTKDKVAEFIEHTELPIAGCQSHPEEDFNVLATNLIKSLIKRSPNLKNENKGNPVAVI